MHKSGNHAAAISKPLWDGAPSNTELQQDYITMMDVLSQDSDVWSYFISWFERYWNGLEINWDFARLVALIPDSVWQEGVASVAHEIEILEERELFAKLPLAEDVALDEQTSRLRVVPIPAREPLRIDIIVSRAADALEDAFSSHNGLRKNSWAAKTVLRAIEKYQDDPQRIEMDFTAVSLSLRRQIEVTSELPDSDENLALIDVLEDSVRSLRGIYPEVAENRRIMSQQRVQEISESDREKLRQSLPLLGAISQGVLQQDFENDIESIVANNRADPRHDDTQPPPPTKVDAAARTFSRVGKIRAILRIGDTVKKIEGSTEFKAAKITTTVAGIIGIGLAIFGVL